MPQELSLAVVGTLYQPPVMLTHEGDSQGAEFLNLWLSIGGHGHGCSDRIAGRL